MAQTYTVFVFCKTTLVAVRVGLTLVKARRLQAWARGQRGGWEAWLRPDGWE